MLSSTMLRGKEIERLLHQIRLVRTHTGVLALLQLNCLNRHDLVSPDVKSYLYQTIPICFSTFSFRRSLWFLSGGCLSIQPVVLLSTKWEIDDLSLDLKAIKPEFRLAGIT